MNEYDKARGQREEQEARTEAGAEAGTWSWGRSGRRAEIERRGSHSYYQLGRRLGGALSLTQTKAKR